MARKIALSLGLFVAFLPYLGFPEDLDTVLYTLAGLVIAFLAWSGKRPAPESTIEEMEGELQNAAEEDAAHTLKAQEIAPKKSVNVPPQESATEDNHREPKENVSKESQLPPDKTVSVSFTKHRSHNLKKRITQTEPQSPT